MNRITLLSLTVPIRRKVTVPIKRAVPTSALQIVKKMENPKGNPLLSLIKKFANNPQKLQEGLEKLLSEGQEQVCNYLINIIALRDKNTAQHLRGVARIATKFAKEMGLSAEETKKINMAALIHDFGKIFTPLKVLKYPGKLNTHQTKVMDKHALRTKQFLEQLGITKKDEFFKNAADLAEKHHTPIHRLKMTGTKTIEEQVLELSDVFSALTMKRDYKRPHPPLKALEIMKEMQTKNDLWDSNMFDQFYNFATNAYCKK